MKMERLHYTISKQKLLSWMLWAYNYGKESKKYKNTEFMFKYQLGERLEKLK